MRNNIYKIASLLLFLAVSCTSTPEKPGSGTSGENRPPQALEVRLEGRAYVGERLEVAYVYSDPDGDVEGASVVTWYAAAGTELRVVHTGRTLEITPALDGLRIYVTVTPADARGLVGPPTVAEGSGLQVGAGLLPNVLVYERRVELPDCSADDPEVFFIRDGADWGRINDPDLRIFCVVPGDYGNLGLIRVTASGTAQSPRFLLLATPDDGHAASLDREQLARYRLWLDGANHWVIDRPAYWEDANAAQHLLVLEHASDNVIQRAYYADTAGIVRLLDGSHRNVLQFFHMEKTRWAVDYARSQGPNPPYDRSIFADHAAIELYVNAPNQSILDNVIVSNELINYVDGIQLVRIGRAYPSAGEPNPPLDASGTVIAGNLIYTTPDVYTDGEGRFTPAGDRAVTENAMDLKFGALDPARPVRILGNVMFGYRVPDATYSNLADNGNAMVFHYGIGNFRLERNYVFDCQNGFTVGDTQGGDPALYNVVFRENVLTDFGESIARVYTSRSDLTYDGTRDAFFVGNVFGIAGDTPGFRIYRADRLTFEANSFVNTPRFYYSSSYPSRNVRYLNNDFYGIEEQDAALPEYAVLSGNRFGLSGFDAEPYRLTLLLRRFTREPTVFRPDLGL